MDHNGRVYVVAGGTGVAGESIVLALLERGATVAVPSRSAERLDALLYSRRLHKYVADISDLDSAINLRDRILADLGQLDGVVASLGGWWEGEPLIEMSAETWHRLMTTYLTSHFVTARAFLPSLVSRLGSVYVQLGGIAATVPHARSGPVSIGGAAETMMLRVLAEELADSPVRLHEVSILTPVVTRHWYEPIEPEWVTGEQVGQFVADILLPTYAGTDLVVTLP